MLLCLLSLGHAIYNPEWHTSLEFLLATCALVFYDKFTFTKDAVTKEQFESVKTAINNLDHEMKSQKARISGVRMQLGFKDG